jgi:hypothetical protein
MELIKEFPKLDELIKRMGASPLLYDFPAPLWGEHEIEIGDLQTNNNGHIVDIAGRLSLTYIQKQRAGAIYKFHIAICSTLSAAANMGDRSKYIVTSEEKFKIIRKHNNETETIEITELKVCRNCLKALNYKNYNNVNNRIKERIYQDFRLDDE